MRAKGAIVSLVWFLFLLAMAGASETGEMIRYAVQWVERENKGA